MRKSLIKHVVAISVSFVLLIIVFLLIITVGSDLYSLIYDYDILRGCLLILYVGSPLPIFAISNRIFEGKGNYKVKIVNTICSTGFVIITACLFNVFRWNNDRNLFGLAALICSIWVLICSVGLSAYYFVRQKK